MRKISAITLAFAVCCGSGVNAAFAQSNSVTFPQFADGRMLDGSFYKSTLMVINTDTRSNHCYFALYGGMDPRLEDAFGIRTNGDWSFTLPGRAWTVLRSTAESSLAVGHGNMFCDYPVSAQVLFSYYDKSSVKLSEATVFPAPAAITAALIADQRDGAHLGLAFAGPYIGYLGVRGYLITAVSTAGAVIGTATVSAPQDGNYAVFLDSLLPVTAGKLTVITITATQNTFHLPIYVIGLRYTGSAFTTIPATVLQ